MSVPRFASVAAVFLALALAGCGDDGDAASGPASFVPADSPMVFEFSRESAEHVANAEALIARLGELPLLGTTLDPRDLIEDAIDESAQEEGVDISFAEDIEPWIGDRAVVGFTSLESLAESAETELTTTTSEDPEFVLALEVSDEAVARDAIDRIIATGGEDVEEVEIAGETVKRVTGDEGGLALVDGSVVLGSTDDALERGFSARDGDSIADDDQYADSFEGLSAEALATAYVDFEEFLELSAGEADAEALEAARSLYGDALAEPMVATLTAEEDSLVLDASAGLLPSTFPMASPSALLDDASGESLAAIGLEDVGGQLRALYEQIAAIAPDDLDRESFEEGLEAQLGLTVDEITEAFGDGVAYVRGDFPDAFAVGFEVELPGESEAPLQLLDRLGQELERSGYETGPPLYESGVGFAAEQAGEDVGFVNVEIGSDSAKALVASDRATASEGTAETLADGELFAQAEAALGSEFELIGLADPGAIIDAAIEGGSLLDVVTGESSPEQAVAEFLSDRLAVAALGSRESDDRVLTRLVMGVR